MATGISETNKEQTEVNIIYHSTEMHKKNDEMQKYNSDILKSFRFRHDCGNVLDNKELPEKTESYHSKVPGVTRGQAAPAMSGAPDNLQIQPATATHVLSFRKFRKRKSNERVQHATKNTHQKPPKDVLIGMEIMTLTKGELKPVKGKMVWVPVNIRKS